MILLDTSAVIWLERGDRRIRAFARRARRLYVSPASLLELQLLIETGRIGLRAASIATLAEDDRWLIDDPPAAAWFEAACDLTWTRDPFDRLLVAHAQVRGWKSPRPTTPWWLDCLPQSWWPCRRPASAVRPVPGRYSHATEVPRMARKRRLSRPGRVVVLEHVSKVLKYNPLGDPHVRPVAVWLPREYDEDAGDRRGRRFPVIYDLVGFTGSGLAHLNWKPFNENVAERAARLVRERRMKPMIIVFPDCFTALGGNQYLNSSAIGRYADYLTQEIVPFVDREFRTLASRDHRGCFGKSSGGYGAIMHGMKYPRTWGAIADHSGDAYFDFVYWHDWPRTLDELGKYRRPPRRTGPYDIRRATAAAGLDLGRDDGRVRRFLQATWKKPKISTAEGHAIMNLCMAATYDPDPRAPNGFRLPVHLETGERIPARWRRWLAHDPIRLVRRYRTALASLRGIYLDCGWRDQYHIQYGSRILSRRLREARIDHRYEEFDDDHSDIDYRMDVSLPFLSRVLS